MSTMTHRIQIDVGGNIYAPAPEGGLEYVGWWNESLRKLSLEDGTEYDVFPGVTPEEFIEGLLLKDDEGPVVGPRRSDCDLCGSSFHALDGSILCPPCEDYARWHKAQGHEDEERPS